MPADAREQIRQLPSGKYQLRFYDKNGVRHSGGAFSSRCAARQHYRQVIEPELNGRPVARRDLTYSDLVEVVLERHAIVAKTRTITELRWRLKQSQAKFGTVPLAELEGMADEIAGYAVTIPERLRYPLISAFRQALEAGVRYGYLTRNPAKLAGPNPMPAPREIRVYTAEELTAIAAELGTVEAAAVTFAAATRHDPRSGPRSSAGTSTRRDASSMSGERRRHAHAVRCRSPGRRSPRSSRYHHGSTAATCSPRRARCPGPGARAVRCRELPPSRMGTGDRRGRGAKPARLYDLRSTFATNALAAGVTLFELARIMGTSVKMIEQHYGTLIDTAHDGILTRLDAAGG